MRAKTEKLISDLFGLKERERRALRIGKYREAPCVGMSIGPTKTFAPSDRFFRAGVAIRDHKYPPQCGGAPTPGFNSSFRRSRLL